MNPLLVLELLTALINEKLQPLRKDILKDNVWKALPEKAKSFNQLQPWQ
jgi:membrane protein required for beta-lactamase induction